MRTPPLAWLPRSDRTLYLDIMDRIEIKTRWRLPQLLPPAGALARARPMDGPIRPAMLE
jgi:hypothetical protein